MGSGERALTIKGRFPDKVRFLFEPAPYKVLYGGRGGGKSWAMARALLLLGARKKLFIVCGREFQRSIKESVHRLLVEQLNELGLASFYEVTEAEIVGQNGTKFAFVGVRNNISAIKSMEGIDCFWLTEATNVSRNSWEVLLPTIRRDAPHGPFGLGSEVYVDFNPESSDDETYQRWVVNPPADTISVEINWHENPWFPEILRKQKDDLAAKDYDSYLTIWEGKTRKSIAGAIYEKELAAAISEGRVGPHVVHAKSRGVVVTFDLGRADMTSLWFWQQFGMEHHAIDFYENCGFGFDHYLQVIQDKRYQISGLWLPHDALQQHLAAAKSIRAQAKEAYPTKGIVRVVPRVSNIGLRINAARQLFPRIYINDVTGAQGIKSLGHYQYSVNEETGQRSPNPLHNWASHAADSFGNYAMALKDGFYDEDAPKKPKLPIIDARYPSQRGTGWMGT